MANIPFVDVTIECDQPLPTDEPTATDNCDNNVTITVDDSELPGACPKKESLPEHGRQQMHVEMLQQHHR
ncbi:MAG: hypothetical protein R2784_14100 [Saprospiraceae bacterium]